MSNNFEEKLNQCDFEIQVRYQYIDDELARISEEMMDIAKAIEEEKVELTIAKELGNDREVRLIQNSIDRLNEKLEYLDKRYNVLEDLYDNMFFKIME